MPQVLVRELVKSYAVSERKAGMMGAVRGLVRRSSRRVTALDGISFTLEAGELVGYIGPNGAGKSTTVKILSGILVPDAGVCQVMGRTPWLQRKAHVARIGVVFGQRTQLWWDLPVVESFELLRDIYRVSESDYRRAVDEMIGLLDLGPLLDTPVRQLSLGQRMRCDLAASLLHSPDILFLDEPTIGLDAVAKIAVRQFIQRLNRERGVTVILTTHDMDDVEALCSRVVLIGQGQILCDGALSDLRQSVSQERRLLVDLAEDRIDVRDQDAWIVQREGRRVTLAFLPTQVATAALISRITARYPVQDLFVENLPIDEIVARFYQEQRL